MAEKEVFSLLVATPDADLASRVGAAAEPWQPDMVVAEGYVSAFKLPTERRFAIIFADCRGAQLPVRELVARLNFRCPSADVVGIVENSPLGKSESPFAVGAAAFISPDADATAIRQLVRQLQQGRAEVAGCGWIGKSPEIRSAASVVLTVAPTEATVLLIGESGTGKELAARAIHENSPRRDKPFMALNCSALAEGTLESELFGHEKGAFTHAFAQKQGVFEAAHGGTIFLDEIGEMPLGLQAKLLRVIEERQVRRVGGTVTLNIDIRVIGATSRDLAMAAEEGSFRRDLYFRLSVIRLVMPRLLDRIWDIPVLVEQFAASQASRKPSFADDAYEQMLGYHWPGNVRELKNFVERLSVLGPSERVTARVVGEFLQDDRTTIRNLPMVTGRSPEAARHDLILAALAELKRDLTEIKQAIYAGDVARRPGEVREQVEVEGEEKPTNLTHLEIETIREALVRTGGNRRQASKLLGIGERTLYRKIKEYGL